MFLQCYYGDMNFLYEFVNQLLKTYTKQVGLYVELTKYVKTMNYKKEPVLLFYPVILECVVNELTSQQKINQQLFWQSN